MKTIEYAIYRGGKEMKKELSSEIKQKIGVMFLKSTLQLVICIFGWLIFDSFIVEVIVGLLFGLTSILIW